MFSKSTHDRSGRTGFTLIEILVVLAIIGILVGILVPVISSAFAKGKEAAEFTEITNLAGALQKFKDRYGVYPPSQFVLIENGDYSPANWNAILNCPSNNGEVGETPAKDCVFVRSISVQYLRRIWPQLVIHTDGTAVTQTEIGDINGDLLFDARDFYDWNGDYDPSNAATNSPNGPWYLQGAECLGFFLGGIPTGEFPGGRPGTGPHGSLGFSKTPQWPMQRVVPGVGRDGPFFDMPSDRLVDAGSDGFWELLPFRKPSLFGPPYAYFSAYEGAGYRPDDLNNLALEPTQPFGVLWPIASTYPTPYRQGSSPNFYIESPGPNPYTVGDPYSTALGWVPRYHKPDGFQIISPGIIPLPGNTEVGYGRGGQFPRDMQTVPQDDRDNLTNFSGGSLQDGKL